MDANQTHFVQICRERGLEDFPLHLQEMILYIKECSQNLDRVQKKRVDMNEIRDNFGVFKNNGNFHEQATVSIKPTHAAEDGRIRTLHYVLEKVEIGSIDSVTIATNMLWMKNIYVPLINELLALYHTVPGQARDAKFVEIEKELQSKVIEAINHLIAGKSF